MAKVTDLNDLLRNRLGVMLAAEREIARMLPKLQKEANDQELSRGFERHAAETRQHVANLEEAFDRLDAPVPRAKASAVEGLELEHKGFAAEAADDVLPEVLDTVAISSATATEHHEIAGYESLITLARGVGADEIVDLLEQNLAQERRMLEEATRVAKRLAGARDELEQDLDRDLMRGAVASEYAPVEERRPTI
jgi:ferritin-like metal-binding protein YciE